MEPIVTVIIPSYNRAHLLRTTIPTYIQEGVKELILVDDCSPDNTEYVVKELQKEFPQIKYVRQPRNMKQTAAKNRGLEEVTTPWVYFGDDDSVLYPGSIRRLYDTCIENDVEACGAIAYYMKPGEENIDLADYVKTKTLYTDDVRDIIDLERFHASFIYSVRLPLVVPFCHACFVIKSDVAKKVSFDTNYIGNAYREETDYIVNCSRIGATFMYDSRAAQINLPTTLATGGARGKSKWKYRYYMIHNNWYFLNKNFDFLKMKYNLRTNKYILQAHFIAVFFERPIKRLLGIMK